MRTGDVAFVFKSRTDDCRRVPAHKCILSAGSPVFDAMFYGPLKPNTEIPVDDASIAAFTEFLQFFYLSSLNLTFENIIEVTNLCKKYQVAEALKLCEAPLKRFLTIDNVCWAYEIALEFNLASLVHCCEEIIAENSTEILATKDFLKCDSKVLSRILGLVQSKCSASIIVEACMEWATCELCQNLMQIKTANPRHKLGKLFNRIPFAGISLNQLFKYTSLSKYGGIFTEKEIKIITEIIMSNKLKSAPLITNAQMEVSTLSCDRRSFPVDTDYFDFQSTFFNSNQRILLTEFFLPRLSENFIFEGVRTMDVKFTIHSSFRLFDKELLASGQVVLTSEKETHVVLSKPVVIDDDKGYEIRLTGMFNGFLDNLSYVQATQLKEYVELDDETEIKFIPGSQLTSRLVFQKVLPW